MQTRIIHLTIVGNNVCPVSLIASLIECSNHYNTDNKQFSSIYLHYQYFQNAEITCYRPWLPSCIRSACDCSISWHAEQLYTQSYCSPMRSTFSSHTMPCNDSLDFVAKFSFSSVIVNNKRSSAIARGKGCDTAKHHFLHQALAMVQQDHCTSLKLVSFGTNLLPKVQI